MKEGWDLIEGEGGDDIEGDGIVISSKAAPI